MLNGSDNAQIEYLYQNIVEIIARVLNKKMRTFLRKFGVIGLLWSADLSGQTSLGVDLG